MKALLDSDFLIGLFWEKDSLHIKSIEMLGKLRDLQCDLFMSNLVKTESATVISYKIGMSAVKKYIEILEKQAINKIFVDEKLNNQIWKLFLEQNRKGTSFIDCSNIVLLQEYNIDVIASFDTFYKKNGYSEIK